MTLLNISAKARLKRRKARGGAGSQKSRNIRPLEARPPAFLKAREKLR